MIMQDDIRLFTRSSQRALGSPPENAPSIKIKLFGYLDALQDFKKVVVFILQR